MGVALENARLFDETQRLLKETEQRAAELAVINSIQQGMAAELDFQAIVDLVGDKLRELFSTADLGIRVAATSRPACVHFLYAVRARQAAAASRRRSSRSSQQASATSIACVAPVRGRHDATSTRSMASRRVPRHAK